MTEPYFLNEIKRQPEVWNSMLSRRQELTEPFRQRQASGPIHTGFAFGCGDSRLAALGAVPVFRKFAPFRYEALPALEFLTYRTSQVETQDLAIPISISGNVDRTVAGMKQAQARGATTIAISNSAEGQLAQGAQAWVNLGFSEPVGFLSSTIAYTSPLLAMLLIGAVSAWEADSAFESGLRQTVENARTIISSAQALARDLVGRLFPATTVYLLATGANMATAEYGAVKFSELTHTPAVPHELEEFAHQQFWTLRATDVVIILAEPGGPLALAQHFANTLTEFGTRVVVITENPAVVGQATGAFVLPDSPNPLWSPLTFPIPIQYLVYYWSLASGLNPNTREHLRSDTHRFTTSRKLTRTKLVGSGL